MPRSSFYYAAKPVPADDLRIMRMLDQQYTETPFYGIRRMTAWLQRNGESVNHKRVQRLLRLMGLYAMTPKKSLSKPNPGHKVYPYLLRDLPITHVNQVWSTDITYIRLDSGFAYLAAVIDWFSRYVIAWELSTSMESAFCCSLLDWSLQLGTPEIFNTDQGSQFTAEAFVNRLITRDIKISMDGRGRALDNIFVERLWRSVKYENVYLNEYKSVQDALQGLSRYFRFYNEKRLHQSLDYSTPAEVYFAQA
jgi:putative transposase